MIGLIEHKPKAPERRSRLVFQFKIRLRDVKPMVWRRIQVPGSYSFWDLHVAITDAFGWLDSHLHVFRIVNPSTRRMEDIGIPDEDPFVGDRETLPGWNRKIAKYFAMGSIEECEYEYDFGDGWSHVIRLEKVLPRQAKRKYPLCEAGRNACPPEDVGGPAGYERFLEAIRNPADEEHDEYLTWVGGEFDPGHFDPAAVRFDDPKLRWRVAFEDADMTPEMRNYDKFRRPDAPDAPSA